MPVRPGIHFCNVSCQWDPVIRLGLTYQNIGVTDGCAPCGAVSEPLPAVNHICTIISFRSGCPVNCKRSCTACGGARCAAPPSRNTCPGSPPCASHGHKIDQTSHGGIHGASLVSSSGATGLHCGIIPQGYILFSISCTGACRGFSLSRSHTEV